MDVDVDVDVHVDVDAGAHFSIAALTLISIYFCFSLLKVPPMRQCSIGHSGAAIGGGGVAFVVSVKTFNNNFMVFNTIRFARCPLCARVSMAPREWERDLIRSCIKSESFVKSIVGELL